MVNKTRLIGLLQDLIRIDSQNPPGEESRIASFVSGILKGYGLKVKIHEFKKGRSNIVAVLKGTNSKRSLLITPHLDTVPAGKSWRKDPFAGKIIGGKLYGLGATDCKCNLACAIEAVRSIIEGKKILDYDLILAATADEESGSELGLIPLLDKGILKADAAIVLDADDFDIIVAQKGLMHVKVKIKGIRAHGAYPWRGVNAIDIAIDIIKEVKSQELSFKKNKYLHPPTINTGTIRGGDKVNIVADWCEFELDYRFLPGSSGQEFFKKLKDIVRKRAKKYSIQRSGIQQPYLIDEDHALVEGLKRAMRAFKIRPRIKGSEGATVITFFQHKGIPAVATGFGTGTCAHIADEYVEIKNLYKGSLVLEEFLKNYSF